MVGGDASTSTNIRAQGMFLASPTLEYVGCDTLCEAYEDRTARRLEAFRSGGVVPHDALDRFLEGKEPLGASG